MSLEQTPNKVPEVTLTFWVITILSTAVAEVAAIFLRINLDFGLNSSLMVVLLLAVALVLQLRTMKYTPWIYWLTVVLVGVVGTEIEYSLSSALRTMSPYLIDTFFSVLLCLIFAVWYKLEKTLSMNEISTPRRECFYWAATLCAFALAHVASYLTIEALVVLGTIKWSFVLVFGTLMALIYFAWRMGFNEILAFWMAYIFTRPFGAALLDFLAGLQVSEGHRLGLELTTAIFLTVLLFLVFAVENGKTQSSWRKS
jgi:uncharacterized membrane-anchored protein